MPKNRWIKGFATICLSCAFPGKRGNHGHSILVVFLLILLDASRSSGQVKPVDPSPLLDQTPSTLADLLRHYKELQLPLPPKGARLVFANNLEGPESHLGLEHRNDILEPCFECQPTQRDRSAEYLIGLEKRTSDLAVKELDSPFDMRIVRRLFGTDEPEPDRPIEWQSWNDRELILAIQCLNIWELLEKVTKQAPTEHRGPFVNDLYCDYLSETAKYQIHFLLQFLTDESIWKIKGLKFSEPNEKDKSGIPSKIEIRNLVAMKLASFWGLASNYDSLSPSDWQKLREKFRVLAEAELKGP